MTTIKIVLLLLLQRGFAQASGYLRALSFLAIKRCVCKTSCLILVRFSHLQERYNPFMFNYGAAAEVCQIPARKLFADAIFLFRAGNFNPGLF